MHIFSMKLMALSVKKLFKIPLYYSLKFQYLIFVKCSEDSELQNGLDVPSKGPADETWLFSS